MRKFAENHPIGFCWFVLIVQIVVAGGYSWVREFLDSNTAGFFRTIWDVFRGDLFPVSYTLIYTLIAFLIIALLKWWRETGFVSIGEWKNLYLFIVPTILTFMVLIPGISFQATAERVSFLTILFYFLLGIREEAFNRGLIQHTLMRKGEIYAIYMSSVFFGLIHLTNLFLGVNSLFVTILQIMRSVAWGIGFGALRFRVRSIYPLMILHALVNIFTITTQASLNDPSWYSNLPSFFQHVIIFELPAYLMALYGFYLIAGSKVPEKDVEGPDVLKSAIDNSGTQSKKSRLPLVLGIALFCIISGIGAYSITFFIKPKSVAPTAPIKFPTNASVGSIIVSPKDDMKSVFVPAGEFLMGSEVGKEDEKPVHTVSLDSFWIDQTEVTNGMYLLCVKDGACSKPFRTDLYDDPDFVDSPVDYVTWRNANDYCTWAGRRLPTESEWEKAASWDDINKKKRVYPWGDTLDCSSANVYIESNNESGCEGYPVKIGSYPSGASYYGAFDMAGNVVEWVADWYDEAYYQVSPYANPKGPAQGKYHVLRGSSFIFEANNTSRQSEGFFNSWRTFYDNVGFRCAITNSE